MIEREREAWTVQMQLAEYFMNTPESEVRCCREILCERRTTENKIKKGIFSMVRLQT